MTHLPDREAAHREAQDLLPWLANGRLDGAELQRVQAHLATCATCRADLDTLYTLQDAADLPAPDLDVDKAFARLLPQLDAVAPADSVPVVPGSTVVAIPSTVRVMSSGTGTASFVAARPGGEPLDATGGPAAHRTSIDGRRGRPCGPTPSVRVGDTGLEPMTSSV